MSQRQGQAAARAMLGLEQRFTAVPFFWSQHYDLPIAYVGYAGHWDRIEVDGRIEERDCEVRFLRGERTLALATIYRDLQSLEFEAGLEEGARATA